MCAGQNADPGTKEHVTSEPITVSIFNTLPVEEGMPDLKTGGAGGDFSSFRAKLGAHSRGQKKWTGCVHLLNFN